MGFTELLTIVFVVLKLIGVITWSWWLVLLPEIIAFALYLMIVVISTIYNVRVHKEMNKLFNKRY